MFRAISSHGYWGVAFKDKLKQMRFMQLVTPLIEAQGHQQAVEKASAAAVATVLPAGLPLPPVAPPPPTHTAINRYLQEVEQSDDDDAVSKYFGDTLIDAGLLTSNEPTFPIDNFRQ